MLGKVLDSGIPRGNYFSMDVDWIQVVKLICFRIVIGSIVGFILLFGLLLYVLRLWMRGPTKGSDNKKKLDGKVVAITGIIHSANILCVLYK